MLRLLLIFGVICTVGAVDLKNILSKYSVLQSCASTWKMFDASGKIPSGIMSGNLIQLGHFDQCLEIDEVNKQSKIKGKYCVIKIMMSLQKKEANIRSLYEVFGDNFLDFQLEQNVSKIEERIGVAGLNPVGFGLVLGWCVPHTCPVDKLSAVLTHVLQGIDSGIKVVPILDGMCQTNDDLIIQYDTNSIIFIAFLSATLLLMIISTFYDAYIQHHQKKPAHIILTAFSVKTNGQKLITVSSHPDLLPCLNGIRVLSMMWVVYSHRFPAVFLLEPLINMGVLFDLVKDPANMYLLNAGVSVDTFFVLSGLLVGYGYCLAKDKGIKFNIILYYLHRYLRLTPVLAVVIWFHVTIAGYFGSGPFWPLLTKGVKYVCEENWWPNLIYIQNYYVGQKMQCLVQSWYLAVDMQLFILSPIILIPLWRWPKQTIIASAVLVLGSMASSFAISYVNDFTDITKNAEYMERYYYATHARYGPWLMGIMLGYYLFILKKHKNSRIDLHPAAVLLGWIACLVLFFTIIFASHNVKSENLKNSFFDGFHRHAWALGVCWVIYACTQGYGGPINSFLSWPFFQIVGRFTYAIYLVHIRVEYAISGSSKTNTYFSNFRMLYNFWGDFMVSLAIAVCLTLAYESPMIIIEKVLFKTGHKPKKPELFAHHTTSGGSHTYEGTIQD